MLLAGKLQEPGLDARQEIEGPRVTRMRCVAVTLSCTVLSACSRDENATETSAAVQGRRWRWQSRRAQCWAHGRDSAEPGLS